MEIFKSCIPCIAQYDEVILNELIDFTKFFTGDEIRIACKEATMMMVRRNIQQRKETGKIKRGVKFEDLIVAIKQIKPASKELFAKHKEWNQKFGNQI